MNLFSPLGPKSADFSDDAVGGCVQRILDAHASLGNAINLAVLNSNETRFNRLVEFKTRFEAKAEQIWGKSVEPDSPYSEAVQYSLDLAQEVSTAIAVSD